MSSDDETIVRVRTSTYAAGPALRYSRDIYTLKRRSSGHDLLDDETANIGPEETIRAIVNFHDVEDGVYRLIACNFHHDWETGICDDYDLKLVNLDGSEP